MNKNQKQAETKLKNGSKISWVAGGPNFQSISMIQCDHIATEWQWIDDKTLLVCKAIYDAFGSDNTLKGD